MKRMLARLFSSIIFTTTLTAAAAANERAEENVRALVDEVQRLHGPSLAEAIVADIDIGRTSRFVLGRHAIGLEERQLDEFKVRFQHFLLGLITSRAAEVENAEIQILNSVDRGAHDCVVSTRVSTPTREPMTMRWRMIETDGNWRLVDVEVHGVWLAIEQRAQIGSLLDRGSRISELYREN
tara:strand:+ start:301 stop:846 length:546 start_codon:yes stop_codon:yes gene_type:complete